MRRVVQSVLLAFAAVLAVACAVTPAGQHIPGAGRDALATTQLVLVCENIEVVPEEIRDSGWIYIDEAYFGQTQRPTYRKALGNALVVGKAQVERNATHRVKIVFKGYEPVVIERFFGNLDEYVLPFRLHALQPKPVTQVR